MLGLASLQPTPSRHSPPASTGFGITGNSLEQLSDLDLFVAIGMVAEHLASDGNADAAADLARYDLEEAGARAFYERPDVAGTCRLVLEPGVRWPYLRAKARWQEANYGQGAPRSAASEAELLAKLTPALAALAQGTR